MPGTMKSASEFFATAEPTVSVMRLYMIKLVSGVHWPDPGTAIEVNGKAHSWITPALAKSLGIHVIYQDLSVFPNLSVAENIAI